MAADALKSAKRFGVRYGRRNKLRFGIIERMHLQSQKCPYCRSMKARRLSAGIWHCRKCKAKFTGKAYTLQSVV